MAALSTTTVSTDSTGDGQYKTRTYRVTTGAASGTEWIATGGSQVVAVKGWGLSGTGPLATAPAAPAQATQTITFTGAGENADTITVNGIVYTYVTGAVDAAYKINVEADQTDQAATTVLAINDTGTRGTDYGANTAANAHVRAASAAGVVTLTANVPGTVGNALTLAKTGTNIAVGAATFASGSDIGTGFNFVLNAQGTSVTAGVNPGDLGIETSGAATIDVTVVYKD